MTNVRYVLNKNDEIDATSVRGSSCPWSYAILTAYSTARTLRSDRTTVLYVPLITESSKPHIRSQAASG
jgi:hypothetical protein